MNVEYAPTIVLREPSFSDSPLEPHRRGLVMLAQAGDADAFARLYDSYADRVYQ
jgi:hypothetical protein